MRKNIVTTLLFSPIIIVLLAGLADFIVLRDRCDYKGEPRCYQPCNTDLGNGSLCRAPWLEEVSNQIITSFLIYAPCAFVFITLPVGIFALVTHFGKSNNQSK